MSNLYHIAQPVTTERVTHCCGAGIHFRAIADDVLVRLAPCVEGVPGASVLAQARISARQLEQPGMLRVQWPPVLLSAGVQYAIVITAADIDTSVGIGQVGAYDADAGQYMGDPPYQIGPLATLTEGDRWVAKPGTYLSFDLLEAQYASASQKIDLGTVVVTDATDLAVRADIESPETGATCVYTLTLSDDRQFTVDGDQLVSLPARYTGPVTIAATLRRGERLGPTLRPGAVLVHGHLQDGGTYVTPAINAAGGNGLRIESDVLLPAGSALQVHQQIDDGQWQQVPYISTSPATTGVLTMVHGHDNLSATTVRVRLTLTGSPTARPLLTNLRVVVI